MCKIVNQICSAHHWHQPTILPSCAEPYHHLQCIANSEYIYIYFSAARCKVVFRDDNNGANYFTRTKCYPDFLSNVAVSNATIRRDSEIRVPVSPTHWPNIARWSRRQHRFEGKCWRLQQQVPPNGTKMKIAMVTILLAIDHEHRTMAFQMAAQNVRARKYRNLNIGHGRPGRCDQFIESALKPFKR